MSQQSLNKVITQYVAYHKQIERRFDGSAGGVYGAFVETVVKEDYYFSGTAFDQELRLKHVVTNDPEQICEILGYRPLESDCSEAIQKVADLLSKGKKVLFCGTPTQCLELKQRLDNTDNLILVDVIDTLFASDKCFRDYVSEIEAKHGSKVKDIRFYNKEFIYKSSKRITLENGRVIFTRNRDSYDTAMYKEISLRPNSTDNIVETLEERVGDISIGAYKMKSNDDGLGYTYISVNSEKGKNLFEKAKKRLVITLDGKQVEKKNIITNAILKREAKILLGSNKQWYVKIVKEILNKLHVLSLIRFKSQFVSTTHLRPRPVFQFIKYNFFSKKVVTDNAHNGYIYFTPYCRVQIEKGAKIELHGPLVVGKKRIESSKQETRLWMQSNSKMIVYDWASFGYGSNIEVYKGATLEIGSLSSNSEFVMICGKHIKLGSPVNVARGCTIRDTNGHIVAVQGYRESRDVEIGNHTWVCSDSTIMPGSFIGDGSIVGACSYISKKVPPFTMVQGSADNVVGHPKYFRI